MVLLAVVGVLVLGGLWARGVRLPETGRWSPLTASLNQILIFSPVLLVPVLRRHPLRTALVRTDRLWLRLLLGVGCAALALAVHIAVRRALGEPVRLLPDFASAENVDIAVQVLLEDLAVAILLVRLAAATGRRATIVLAALLFAAAHIPAMLAGGAAAAELIALVRDVALGVLVLGAVLRSGDVAWFWPVHLTMDLTQFARVMGVGS